MQTISQHPIHYYSYSTAVVTINWNNKPQHLGRFNTAIEALKVIETIENSTPSKSSLWSIQTPTETIKFK